MNFVEAFNHLVETKRYKWKYSTYCKYQYLYSTYLYPYFHMIQIEDIDDLIVREYFDALELSNSSKLILRNIMNQMLEPYGIKIHYCIRKINKDIVVLSNKEQNQLIDYIYSLPYSTLNLGILICLYGGLRLGEICAIKWEDINISEQSILITKTIERLPIQFDHHKTQLKVVEPKSIASNRKVPIPSKLIHYLLTLPKGEDYFLSNKNSPYDPRSYEYYFSRLLKKANIRKVNFHALRHTFATRCIEKEIDVKTISEILGHSDISITIKYYVKSSFEFKKRQIEKLIDQ